MAGNVREVGQSNFDTEVKANQVTLADFWAPWCGPCRMVAPVVEAIADDMQGKAGFIKVNVDDNQALAAKYDVRNIPTLVLFKDGKEVNRIVGVRGKAEIQNAITALL